MDGKHGFKLFQQFCPLRRLAAIEICNHRARDIGPRGQHVGAGIALDQVWKLATADRLGADSLGRLQRGAPADILLFRRDPTARIENLASLEAVVTAGKLYRVADLEQAIAANQAYFSSLVIKPLANRGAERALARAIGRG